MFRKALFSALALTVVATSALAAGGVRENAPRERTAAPHEAAPRASSTGNAVSRERVVETATTGMSAANRDLVQDMAANKAAYKLTGDADAGFERMLAEVSADSSPNKDEALKNWLRNRGETEESLREKCKR